MAAPRFHICAEVAGQKVNLEVAFDRPPESVEQVAFECDRIFSEEAHKRNDNRRFRVDFIVFFEDATRRWRPLEHVSQLTSFMQLYCFQPAGTNETVGEIPQPSGQYTASGAAARVVHRPGQPSVSYDKVKTVFEILDISGNGSIELGEMVLGFLSAGIDFNEETIKRIFDKSDANSDGQISQDEFQVFAELFPNTVETLYWRLRTIDTTEPSSASESLKSIRRRELQLRREMAEMERKKKELESRLRTEQKIARDMDPHRRILEEEEQDLINKEFALQFHRDMCVQAEAQFGESVIRFDHASRAQGSPRRARQLGA